MRKFLLFVPPLICGLVSLFFVSNVSLCLLKSFTTFFLTALLLELAFVSITYKYFGKSKLAHSLKWKLNIDIKPFDDVLTKIQTIVGDRYIKLFWSVIFVLLTILGWQGLKPLFQPQFQLCCQSERFETTLKFMKRSSTAPVSGIKITAGDNVFEIDLKEQLNNPGTYSGELWGKNDVPYYFINYEIGNIKKTYTITPDYDLLKIDEPVLVQFEFLEDFYESLTENRYD